MAGCTLGVGGIGVNGTRAANRLAADSDLVLCVGTRLTDFTTGSRSLFRHPEVRFVGLNVCAADAHKHSAAPLVADARLGLEALTAAGVRPRGDRRESARHEVVQWRAALDADRAAGPALLTQSRVYAEVNRAARAGDWLVAAAGWAPGDLLKSWDVVPGSRAHIEFGFSCMGHEIPAALGIRMHDAGAGEVFVVIGDGTYLMGASELATAVQNELKIVVILLDNGGFGSIDALARAGTGVSVGNRFVTRATGAPLVVDFVANAASLGCQAERATDAAALREALERARSARGPVLIACPTDPDRPLLGSGAFWDLGVPEVADDGTTRRLTAAHRERARALQRHY
jgi:3D-(3,5/4)-trihydroxycyclohexane-1,2-dione acylhydrolase (decyclizing)